MANPGISDDQISAKLRAFKEGAEDQRNKKIVKWDENTHIARDVVFVDRIKQTQTANVPITKETIKTMLANIDDSPDIQFESRKNDRHKEMMLNEYWKYNAFECNQLEIKDILIKKQMIMYGRGNVMLNIVNSRPVFEIVSNYDLLIDRNVDVTNIDSAQYICRERLYKQVKELENDPDVDQTALMAVKRSVSEKLGITKNQENANTTPAANKAQRNMGDVKIDDPAIGEAYIETNLQFMKLWDSAEKEWCIWVFLTCDWNILKADKLENLMNIDFFPIESWGDDLELGDWYSDAPIDPVVNLNKIINVWISQFSENRTMRNFGMHYYDASNPKFVPQTYQPGPWKWLPVPGNPAEVIKQVDIPELSSVRDDINWLVNMAERSSAASSTIKGDINQMRVTLGEVQLAEQQATKRLSAIAKFYRPFYQRLGKKWSQLVLNNKDSIAQETLYKKGVSGKTYSRNVSPEDFYDEKGYSVQVISSSENEKKSLETLQKYQGVYSLMPNNEPLKKALNKKLVGILDLTPEEEKTILEFEDQKQTMPMGPNPMPNEGSPMPTLPGAAAPNVAPNMLANAA